MSKNKDTKDTIKQYNELPAKEINISDYSEISYLEYAMSVVKGRAIPFIQDGLKPVHRRVLYSMALNGMDHKSLYKKSARVVGDVIGKYHPHGDVAVYEALVRQSQEWQMRYPLIDGQGNFGSRDGDGAAAMRYCFAADSRIMNELGLVKIVDIPKLTGQQGNTVNLDLNTNSLTSANKITKWLYSGVQDIVEITTEKGYKVRCTPNEPLYILNENLDYVWKNVEELRVGDRVSINTKNHVTVQSEKALDKSISKGHEIDIPEHMSTNLASFIGLIVANGSITASTVEFSFSNARVYATFKQLVNNLFGEGARKKVLERLNGKSSIKHQYYAVIDSNELVGFLKHLGINGCHRAEKVVPEIIFQSSAAEVAAFIGAYWEAAGSIHNNILSLSSACTTALEDIKQLLLNYFGIISNNIHLDKECSSGRTYRLQITSNDSVLKFKNSIEFLSNEKQSKLQEARKIADSARSFEKNYIPHLAHYLKNYFKERVVSRNYIRNEHNDIVLKQNAFGNISKFSKLQTAFKLDYYLSLHKDKLAQHFPNLLLKLEDILNRQYFNDKIVSIKNLQQQEAVYDLTVANTHAFTANGFIAHNTEIKLQAINQLYLDEIKDRCVDFQPNYDGAEIEPKVLPSRLPFILLNGNPGIGVGIASEIPSHNMTEVIKATIHYLENPTTSIKGLMRYIKGPDFPTKGTIISSKAEIEKVYTEGRGPIRLRGKYHIEGDTKNWRLVFEEIPYGVSVEKLMLEIEDIFNPENKAKKDAKGNVKKPTPEQERKKRLFMANIEKYLDASNKSSPTRLVIQPKSYKQNPDELAKILLAYTSLEVNYSANFTMVGLDGLPVQKDLLTIISEWCTFRLDTIKRRCEYHLEKINARLHILEGRKIILDNIDEAIRIIRFEDEPKLKLMKTFKLSDIQAEDVLDLKLRYLSNLELATLIKEMDKLSKEKEELIHILSTPETLKAQMVKELTEDMNKFGDKRLTEIIEAEKTDIAEIDEKASAIAAEKITVAISKKGWIKTARGEKTVEDFAFKEGDTADYVYNCMTTDTIAVFDEAGKVYNIELTQVGKETPINTLCDLGGSKFALAYPVSKDSKYLLSHTMGYGFIVKGENLFTRLKAGKEMFSLPQGAKQFFPIAINGQNDLSKMYACLISTENRLLVYKLDEISEIGKGKGVGLMGFNNNHTLKNIKLVTEKSVDIKVREKRKEFILNVTGDEFSRCVQKRSVAAKGKVLNIKDKLADIDF